MNGDQERGTWPKWHGYIGMRSWGKGSPRDGEGMGRGQGERSPEEPGC